MNISEKAAHLKGLIEGMDLDANTKEAKLFSAIANLLEDITLSVSDLEDEAAMLNEYIEEIDEDLGEIEREVYECDDDCGCDCDCCCDEQIELECPACGEKIELDSDDIDELETIDCPKCGKTLQIEIDEEDDE